MCAGCSAKDEALRTLSAQNDQQAEEIAGMHAQRRRDARAETALRTRLKFFEEQDPDNDTIMGILDHWHQQLCPWKKVRLTPTGARAGLARHALKGHEPSELEEAINGLALLPYVVSGKGRRPTGEPDQWYGELRYVLKDETSIQHYRDYWHRASSAAKFRQREAWEMVSAVADRHFDLWMRTVAEPEPEIIERPTLFLVKEQAA